MLYDVICRYFLGGLINVPQKHRGSVSSHYNSGFFITTNEFPDFGGGRDGEAIKRRLCVFETKALKRKDTSISGRYLKESTDCLYFNAIKLLGMVSFLCILL